VSRPNVLTNGVVRQMNDAEYAQYQIDSAAPPPSRVSKLQLVRALRQRNLFDAVQAAMPSAPQAAQDAWNYMTVAERADPLLVQMAAALGLSGADVDALFVLADTF
jgi:Rod binding domain-containing protein